MRYPILDPSFHSPLYYKELNRSLGLWGKQRLSLWCCCWNFSFISSSRNSITLVESDRLYWRGDHGKHFQIDVRRTAGTLPPLRSARSLPLNTSRSNFTNYDLQVFCSICCSYSFIRIDQTVFSGDHVGKVILNESICSVQRLTALSLLGFSKTHLFPYVLKASHILSICFLWQNKTHQ